MCSRAALRETPTEGCTNGVVSAIRPSALDRCKAGGRCGKALEGDDVVGPLDLQGCLRYPCLEGWVDLVWMEGVLR